MENVVKTKISMTTEGTSEAVEQYAALNAEAEKTAENIKQADDAAKGLNTTLGSTPSLPSESAGAVQGVKVQASELNKTVKEVSGGFGEAGQAGRELSGVMNQIVPGLGFVSNAFMSMNPVAIAGTLALTGIVAVMGQLQKQAEETRKAAEDEAKAESDRFQQQLTIDQRTTAALAGDSAAREGIIKDLANYTSQKALLEKQGVENANNIVKQLKIINDLDSDKTIDISLEETKRKIQARREAQGALDGFNSTATDLNKQAETINSQFKLLTESSQKLGLTQQEQVIISKSAAQGTDAVTASLDKLWKKTDEGATSIEDFGKGLSSVFGKIGDTLIKAAEDATHAAADAAKKTAEERVKAENELIATNEKLTDVESERGKVLADRAIEDQRNAALGALNDRLTAAQAYDAALSKNKKVAEIEQQGHAADITAQAKYMEDQQKVLASYLKAEQNATEDYSRERVRKLEDLYNTLGNLASQRDVAGFVNARRSGLTDISRGDEDAGISAQRRRDTYTQQAKDLQAAFAKENVVRQSQLQQRLQQEAQAGQAQITQASIVQKAISDLHAQYAAADLRARQQAEDATYRQTVTILQRKRDDELRITAGAAAGVINLLLKAKDTITRISSSANEATARGIPKYDQGTPYLPHDGLIYAHKGERIVTAADNARTMRNGGQTAPNYVIQLSVGEHVSQGDLRAVKDQIVGAITSFGGNSNN